MAIAFDAVSEGSNSGQSSLTIAHTTAAGSDMLMVVGVFDQAGDTVTDVTYNGVSMFSNLVQKGSAPADGTNTNYLFYLVAPSSGTNNLVITRSSSSNALIGKVTTYSGVDQSSPLNTSNEGTATTGNSLSISFTTTVDDCWATAFGRNTDEAITDGTNYVQRSSNASIEYGDSNASLGAAAAETIGPGNTAGGKYMAVGAFAPSAEDLGVDTWHPNIQEDLFRKVNVIGY